MEKREERVDNSPLLSSFLDNSCQRMLVCDKYTSTYTRKGVGIAPHHHYTSWNVGITICPF